MSERLAQAEVLIKSLNESVQKGRVPDQGTSPAVSPKYDLLAGSHNDADWNAHARQSSTSGCDPHAAGRRVAAARRDPAAVRRGEATDGGSAKVPKSSGADPADGGFAEYDVDESVHDSNPQSDSNSNSDREGRGSRGKKPSSSSASVSIQGTVHGAWDTYSGNEDGVYKEKNLKLVKVTKLPVDSTCREWRRAFVASVSRIDTTDGDALAKYVSHCFEGGWGKGFREALRNSVMFTRFNKHVAAELIQTDVLATNTELAAQFSSYVEACC